MTKRPIPPQNLSPRSKKIFSASATAISIGRRAMLEECLAHLDRATTYREIVAREGALSNAKRGKMRHVHPLAALAAREQAAFEKMAFKLGIHWDSDIDGADFGLVPWPPRGSEENGETED